MDDKSSKISTRVPVRLAARILNRLAAVILSFLTLLRFMCPEEDSSQSLLRAASLRQQRLLDYRFTINEYCHRISQAYPNEGGLPSYRAALENLNDFSSNVSGVKVTRWSEIMDARLLQPHVCCCTDTE